MIDPNQTISRQRGNAATPSHEEMIGLHAGHELIGTSGFKSREEYTLHLIHTAAYLKAAQLVGAKKVLDLGCNTGYGTDMLSRAGCDVVGADILEKAIAAARNRYGHRGIEFRIIDGKTLPFEDGMFDAVVSFQVIEHVVDYNIYVDEIQRVLNPAGLGIFTTPNALLRLDPGMKPWNPFHVREFDHASLKDLLGAFFRCVDIFGLFAKEPYYSIEVDRLAKAREQARGGFQKEYSLYDRFQKILPQPAVDVMEKVRHYLSFKSRMELRTLITKHWPDDFFYRQSDLDSALDLMAVCCKSAVKTKQYLVPSEYSVIKS